MDLPVEQVPRYLELFRRMASGDPRVQYKKLGLRQANELQVKELWEAKATKKYRLFIDSRTKPITILSFGHRGENGIFRRER